MALSQPCRGCLNPAKGLSALCCRDNDFPDSWLVFLLPGDSLEKGREKSRGLTSLPLRGRWTECTAQTCWHCLQWYGLHPVPCLVCSCICGVAVTRSISSGRAGNQTRVQVAPWHLPSLATPPQPIVRHGKELAVFLSACSWFTLCIAECFVEHRSPLCRGQFQKTEGCPWEAE